MEPIERAKEGGHELIAEADRAFEAGEIDEAEWHGRMAEVITPAYLAAANPRAQSGHSGDEAHWDRARSIVLDGVLPTGGTFLDIGCANGHLMECLVDWGAERGVPIEPYGLDVAPELAELARTRLPRWADRIWVGNAATWEPPFLFDHVRTGLEYVPTARRAGFVERLLTEFVRPGGRLIIGTYNEEPDGATQGPLLADLVAGWGFEIAGRSVRPHWSDDRIRYKVFWLEAPSTTS